MPISLLRADNNLPPWRPGLKEVPSNLFDFIWLEGGMVSSSICSIHVSLLPLTLLIDSACSSLS